MNKTYDVTEIPIKGNLQFKDFKFINLLILSTVGYDLRFMILTSNHDPRPKGYSFHPKV